MQIPERLGPYIVDGPLGKGGMGQVFLAHEETTGERVALKSLSPHLAESEGFRDRFEAEIASLKTLRHSGIVRLYGYGEDQGVLFYAMELVDGASLDQELKAGRRFTWREVTTIASAVCRALKHAHDHGIIHRDIKPANILIDKRDRVKLADFGIARLFSNAALTTAGGILGTADYMSPEQAAGQPVTDRTDQYSLGCVMYTLLAGRQPFRGSSLPEMLQLQRFHEPEPLLKFAPATPKQLVEAIRQLMSKSAADRFPNTLVLAKHLEAMALALSRHTEDDFQLEVDGIDMGVALPIHDSLSDTATKQQQSKTPGYSEAPHLLLPPQPETPEVKKTHFTAVSEDWRDPAPEGWSWQSVAIKSVLSAAVLGGLLFGVSWLLSPPSAASLENQINSAVEDRGEEGLRESADQIAQFLNYYPNHPSAESMREMMESIELSRLERRLSFEVRLGAGRAETAEQRLYFDAVALGRVDPVAGIQRLDDLASLLSAAAAGGELAAESRRQFRLLAVRQKTRLEKQVAESIERQRDLLEDRLQTATSLKTASPRQASMICRGIEGIFSCQSWAAPYVQRAKTLRAQIEQTSVAAETEQSTHAAPDEPAGVRPATTTPDRATNP